MKKKIRGLTRKTFLLDYDLYRVQVPVPDEPNHKLSVIDINPEHARQTILFQHGYAGVGESFEFQINHFSHDYRVIVPDLRGHGQSDAPYSRYTMDELVADMRAIVEHLEIIGPFILVGHSFGGSVCVEYASAYPESLDKLVLIATAGEYPLPRAVRYLSRLPVAPLRPLWRYRPRWDAELHVMKRMLLNNLRKWRGWSLLRHLSMETLIITGERDTYFPRYVFADVGKMVPHAEIYDVGSAKHKVQLERHEAVNRALERFIRDQRTSWRASDLEASALLTKRPWIRRYSPETPVTVPIPRQSLDKFLESAAAWKPRRTATIFNGQKLSYDALDRRVNQFAHALLQQSIQPGDRVLVLLPTSPQMLITYYAILRIGAVVVLPDPDGEDDDLLQQAQQTGCRLLITMQSRSRQAHMLRQEVNTLEQIVFVTLRGSLPDEVYRQIVRRQPDRAAEELAQQIGVSFTDIMADQPETDPAIPVNSDDLACIIFTDATHQTRQGICLTHHNLVANALQTRHWLTDLNYGAEVFLSVLPFAHSYGMTVAMNVPITIAATIVMLPVFEVHQVLAHIKKYRPTIFPGVPAMYTAINQASSVRGYGLSTIKACISGGESLPVEVHEAFEKRTKSRLVEWYGLAEATAVTHATPFTGMRKVGSVGVPLPNTDARIVDWQTGQEQPPGTIGELIISGPQVMQGYWQSAPDDDHTVSTLRDGWLHTGDVAVMDSEGFFRIINRKDDLILIGDHCVYPRDVEEVLHENNRVMEAVVVHVSHDGDGNGDDDDSYIKAFVVPRAGARITTGELIALCRRRLDAIAVPREIEFRTSLPRSAAGKVMRDALMNDA